MPLDNLVERIIGDSRTRAAEIRDEAARRRGEILAEAVHEADDRYERIVRAATREAEDEKKHRVTLTSLESRKSLLEEKQRLIREVFDRVLEALGNLPRDRYMALVARMLDEAAADGGGEVLFSPRDRERLGEELISMLNAQFERAGVASRVRLSEETLPIRGGFLLRRQGIEINGSFEALLESRRDELENKVAGILFGGAS